MVRTGSQGHRRRVQSTNLVRRALLAVLLAAVAFGGTLAQAPPTGADDDPIARAIAQQHALQERITQQQDQVALLDQQQVDLQAKVDETTSSLESINIDQDSLRAEIATATDRLTAARQRQAELVREVANLDATVDFLQAQADDLRLDLRGRRQLLAAHLAEAYRSGQTSVLEQMLSSDSLLDGMVEQHGFLALGQQDVDLARSIEHDALILAAQQREVSHVRYRTERLRRQVEIRAAELDDARDQLLTSQERLARLEAETARLLDEQRRHHAELLANKADAEALLKKQEIADKRLTAKIAKLIEQEQHRGRLPSEYNGTLRWPVKGTVTQEFGCTGVIWERPHGDCEHWHEGIDIVGETEGPPIVAAADGIIIFAGYNPFDIDQSDPAWIVIIGHSDDLQTYYAHLKPKEYRTVKAGLKVKAGQVIGYMGNSGKSTGEHLHWGVQYLGEFVNPRLFL
jgi:murein DD-endopeptidase MepM/ murein hydrolase activator NlpD